MEKTIAFCGLNCAKCPTFLATRENSDEKRKQVAEQWSKEYSAAFTLEDINCYGCLSDHGPLFGYCLDCKIRQCGQKKEVENCARCDDYPCQKLDKFFQLAPGARINLNEIRKTQKG